VSEAVTQHAKSLHYKRFCLARLALDVDWTATESTWPPADPSTPMTSIQNLIKSCRDQGEGLMGALGMELDWKRDVLPLASDK
jgi:hypothetical protein